MWQERVSRHQPQKNLCVELPDEVNDGRKDEVGVLNKSRYDTRSAAANFNFLVKTVTVINSVMRLRVII